MDSFKLPNDARIAFKQKRSNRFHTDKVNNKTFVLKQEIKTEPERDFNIKKEPQTILIKHENTKVEPIFSQDAETKHETSSIFSENDKKSESNYSFRSENKSKFNCYKQKTGGRRRLPIFTTAVRVHRYLSVRDPNTLTQKQIDSLNWSEAVLMGRYIERSRPPPAPIEIPDDDDSSSIFNEGFIQNEPIPSTPDSLQLAVVDFCNPGGRYSLANARLIEKTLTKAVTTYILENPENAYPKFGKSVYFDGVLVLDCKDEVSYDFARLVLWDQKLWHGCSLKVVEPQKTPFDSIGCLQAPDVGIDKNKVLDVLKIQNPCVNMTNWKILDEKPYRDGYKQYSIKICNPPIYFQKHKQLRLYYGGSEVFLKLYGCEWLWNCDLK